MTDNALAPILLFVYNRPQHTRRLLDSLLANDECRLSSLYVYSDGARDEASASAVAQVRAIVHSVTGFARIEVIEREKNMGLAANVIDGVTTQVRAHGRVIVLEDDLVLSPFFLRFMNDALSVYADEPRVGHIQACDFTGDRPTLSLSNSPEAGAGQPGSEPGAILTPTESNCSPVWNKPARRAVSTSTVHTCSHECYAVRLPAKTILGPSDGMQASLSTTSCRLTSDARS